MLVTALGATLFQAVIRDEVRDVYRAAAARADAAGHGLRIKLTLTGAPSLSALPWEMLFDEGSFLVLDRTTPVVRSLDLPQVQTRRRFPRCRPVSPRPRALLVPRSRVEVAATQGVHAPVFILRDTVGVVIPLDAGEFALESVNVRPASEQHLGSQVVRL